MDAEQTFAKMVQLKEQINHATQGEVVMRDNWYEDKAYELAQLVGNFEYWYRRGTILPVPKDKECSTMTPGSASTEI